MPPAYPPRGRHTDPEKTAARLGYANRMLRRRLAELQRERDEARQRAGRTPNGERDGTEPPDAA
jgi:hypothetical protein